MTTISFSQALSTKTKAKTKQVAFTTVRTGDDRVSAAVQMHTAHYDKETNSIKVFCHDGKLRECRVERLPSKAIGQKLWKDIQEAGKAKKAVQFVAAGGFNPDRWFYQIKVSE